MQGPVDISFKRITSLIFSSPACEANFEIEAPLITLPHNLKRVNESGHSGFFLRANGDVYQPPLQPIRIALSRNRLLHLNRLIIFCTDPKAVW
jgi:hypothetical protein